MLWIFYTWKVNFSSLFSAFCFLKSIYFWAFHSTPNLSTELVLVVMSICFLLDYMLFTTLSMSEKITKGIIYRSLKLGIVPGPTASPGPSQPSVYTSRTSIDASSFSWNEKKSRQGKESSILTRACLIPLVGDSGAAGYVLIRIPSLIGRKFSVEVSFIFFLLFFFKLFCT